MDAIVNFLTFLSNHWTMILMVLTAAVAIVSKTRKWIALDNEQRKTAIIEAIRRSMLYLVVDAEREFGGGTGSLKRSKVLEKIFTQYPILAQYADLDIIVKQLDDMIDESLDDLNVLLQDNEKFKDLMNGIFTVDAELLEELAIGKQIGTEVQQIMAENEVKASVAE